MNLTRPAGLILALILGAAPAGAVDGVIEINTASASVGGVTPGDSPGLPVTISRSGSYRLTSDLLTTNEAVGLIVITADRVSLDLNGFTVGSCVSGGLCGTGSAHGIQGLGADDLHVHGGNVRGSNGTCILGGSRARMEDVNLSACGRGIDVGASSRLTGVTVTGSNGSGVWLGTGSILHGSIIEGSGTEAVVLYRNALLVDSVLRDNAVTVAFASFSSATSAGYKGCIITGNGVGEVQFASSGMANLGGNVCGSDTICP